MTAQMTLQLCLDDLLADLRYSRRRGDLGRLALIAYCDVRRWARQAGSSAIAEQATAMFSAQPHASREAFLEAVDRLIVELEQAQSRFVELHRVAVAPPAAASVGLAAQRH